MTQGGNPAPGFKSNPDKKIALKPHAETVTVKHGETVVAATQRAIELREDGYPVVVYIPFDDVKFEHLSRTATTTHCPYKGDATYWRFGPPGDGSPDIMWAYENPYDEVIDIKDHGAFNPDRVEIKAN